MRTQLLFLATALVSCNDKGDDSSGNGGNGNETDDSSPPAAEDADNDGFDVTEDCNDADPAINPDATEICDGVDNDCVDGVDVNATDATDYYADADGDTYGAGKATASCEVVKGQVTNDEDCDDTRADVNPDGQEEITVYLEGLENPRSEVAPHRERGYNIERFREMTEVELKKLALLEAEHGPCLPMAFVIWRPGMGLGDDDDDPSERWKKGE